MILLSTDLIMIPSYQWEQGYICVQHLKEYGSSEKKANVYLATRAELYRLFAKQAADIQIGTCTCKEITEQSMLAFIEFIELSFSNETSICPHSIVVTTTNKRIVNTLLHEGYDVLATVDNVYSFKNLSLDLLWKFKDEWGTIRVEGLRGTNEIPIKLIQHQKEQQYLF